jgi:regulation of enolase protein 1 (concanavalin A-like superfamily)
VQAFYQTEPAKAGWQAGTPFAVQEGVQWWVKDKFVIALNIFPPSQSRKETRISVVCAMNRGSAAPSPARTAVVVPQPTATQVAAPVRTPTGATPATPAGSAAVWNFDVPNDESWYGEGGIDATVGTEDRPGFLRFTAPSGNDLFPNTNLDAPTVFRVVNGDFTMEAQVEFAPTEDYQGAGVFIWQDRENFVRLERCYSGIGGGESGICFLKVSNGEIESIAGAPQLPTTAKRVDLRLQRAGKRVTAWWREASAGPAGAWQPVGSVEIDLPGGPQPLSEQALRAGMLLCVEGAAEISADFDAFRLWTQ